MLIDLAADRLRQAQQDGGNRVVACSSGEESVAPIGHSPSLERALEMLRTGQEAAVLPHLTVLLGQMLPVLKLFDRECHLGLPIEELERRCTDLAHRGEDAGQK